MMIMKMVMKMMVLFQVSVGNGLGIRTGAVLSCMDGTIGRCVGNSLEVMESLETLKGRGPDDLMELVTTLGNDFNLNPEVLSRSDYNNKTQILIEFSLLDSDLNLNMNVRLTTTVQSPRWRVLVLVLFVWNQKNVQFNFTEDKKKQEKSDNWETGVRKYETSLVERRIKRLIDWLIDCKNSQRQK